MKLRRFLCLASAAAVVSVTAAFSAYADSKDVDDFWANPEKLTVDTSAPTLSFDMPEYEQFIRLTNDASLIDLTAEQDKSQAYQGASLKISASLQKEIKDFCTYSDIIRDEQGNLLYPEAGKEDASHVTMGIRINAGDLGANYFDGCMITFKYRINQEVKGKLLDDSIFVFPTDDKYNRISQKPVTLKINTSDSNNVTQYAQGVVTVPENVGATQLIFEVPIVNPMEKTDVLYLDNLTVTTPLKSGDNLQQLENADGYNANAKAEEIVKGLEIKEKENTYSSVVSEADSEDSKLSVGFIAVAAAIAAVVAVIIVIAIIKYKNRFY